MFPKDKGDWTASMKGKLRTNQGLKFVLDNINYCRYNDGKMLGDELVFVLSVSKHPSVLSQRQFNKLHDIVMRLRKAGVIEGRLRKMKHFKRLMKKRPRKT